MILGTSNTAISPRAGPRLSRSSGAQSASSASFAIGFVVENRLPLGGRLLVVVLLLLHGLRILCGGRGVHDLEDQRLQLAILARKIFAVGRDVHTVAPALRKPTLQILERHLSRVLRRYQSRGVH